MPKEILMDTFVLMDSPRQRQNKRNPRETALKKEDGGELSIIKCVLACP